MKANLEEKTLSEIRTLLPNLETSVEKLGVVLEELCEMLAAEGSGIDIFLPQYVAEARGNIRYLIEVVEGENDEEKSQKSM